MNGASGTAFGIEDPRAIPCAALVQRHRVASVDEIREIMEKCEDGQALCLSCEDGVIVVSLQAYGDDLELFVWIALALRHGAVERQESALRAIARDLGAKTIAFQARRAGWGRRLGPEWTRRGTTEFMRRV